MRRASKVILATFGVLLGLASIGAQANVIYNWKTLDTSEGPQFVSSQLVVTDAAWRAGSATFNNQKETGIPVEPFIYAYPDSPIVKL